MEKLGVTREQLGGGVLHISLGGETTVIDEVSEERLTNTLVKLTRTAEKKVYFLTGHNERPYGLCCQNLSAIWTRWARWSGQTSSPKRVSI